MMARDVRATMIGQAADAACAGDVQAITGAATPVTTQTATTPAATVPAKKPTAKKPSAKKPSAKKLPAWRSVLAVVAHPDDESFGLGGVIAALTAAGSQVHVLCYTRGEASTLGQAEVADLRAARTAELRAAGTALGAASVRLLDYADGGLGSARQAELAGHVLRLAARHKPQGLLVFDETGVTGHQDHQAATAAARAAALMAGLPVLAWTLPAAIASRLTAETSQSFAGQRPEDIDMCVRVDRAAQRRAAMLHATQVSPGAVLWRRLQLLGDREHLRWLIRPG
jgi:N-acetylglucosamine malate deacetylase 2